MDGGQLLEVARDAIMVLLTVAGPVMVVALVVGLIIAFFQALTQIQEMTLTFVPKILVIFLALILFLPLMGQSLSGLMDRIAERIVGVV
ncbi:MAG: flagellar biosynthesis protein FliQ [Sphingomonadales bacterium]